MSSMATAKQYEITVDKILRSSSRPRTTENLLADLARAHGDPGMDEADLEALLASFPGILRTPEGWRLAKRPPPPREHPESDLDRAIGLLLEHSKGPLGVAAIFKHFQRVAPRYTRKQVLAALQHPRIARTAPGKYDLQPDERKRRALERARQEQANPLTDRAHAALEEGGAPRSSRALAQRCGATTGKLHAALAGDERFAYDEDGQRWRLSSWDGALRALLASGTSDDLERTAQLHALLRAHGETTLATLATLSRLSRAALLELARAQAGVFALTERHRVGVGTAKHVSYGVGLTFAARSAHPIARAPARDPEPAPRHELRRTDPSDAAPEAHAPTPMSAREVLARLLATDEPN